MFPFIETLKIENGEVQHLDLHLQRIQHTCMEYYGAKKNLDDMRGYFNLVVKNKQALTKLSIFYDLHHHHFVSNPYYIKKIETLYWVENNAIDYHLKYADRSLFDHYSQRVGPENEVLIVQHQRLTDATYANLAFWNGVEWHTPLYPLLQGTKRKYLLETNQLIEKDIFVTDLKHYQHVSLINAMLELGDSVIDTQQIVFLSD
ncbi:MAG TPA: aminotransferase class IV [Chitinophagaceae bacterium]|nr:aminotransferase class IV [Chitinophagaceae bacterium]